MNWFFMKRKCKDLSKLSPLSPSVGDGGGRIPKIYRSNT